MTIYRFDRKLPTIYYWPYPNAMDNVSQKLFQMLFVNGIQLVTGLRRNTKNQLMSINDKILLRKRSVIETINDELKNICQIHCIAMYYFAYLCKMNKEFFDTWTSQLKKGLLSFIVLSVLKHKEYYGYELISEVQTRLNIDIAEGTLYPLLNRLKDEGLVTSKWVEQDSGMPRKYYVINELGLSTLKSMNEYWININFAMQKLILTNG